MKRSNALALFALLTILLLAFDRITKVIAIDTLSNSDPVVFLPAFLDFVLVYNTGGAFGIFEGGIVFFVGVAVIALIAIIAYLIKAKTLHLPVVIALSMISAGAVGNAYDRVVDGAVPDFIHTLFIEFPVFNVADICLTVGEILLLVTVIYYWFGPKSREQPAVEEELQASETSPQNNPDPSLHSDSTLFQSEHSSSRHSERSEESFSLNSKESTSLSSEESAHEENPKA